MTPCHSVNCHVTCFLVTVNSKLLGVLLSVSSDVHVESEDSRVCDLLTKGSLLCSVTDLSAYCMPKTLPCTIGSTLSQSYIYISTGRGQGCGSKVCAEIVSVR